MFLPYIGSSSPIQGVFDISHGACFSHDSGLVMGFNVKFQSREQHVAVQCNSQPVDKRLIINCNSLRASSWKMQLAAL